ncbi:MAG TPA: diacylglycerol kinase family protein [Opitutaceae bacterium]|nr:diacylglycerol kinase family protein [Opitutaceae bacterium]
MKCVVLLNEKAGLDSTPRARVETISRLAAQARIDATIHSVAPEQLQTTLDRVLADSKVETLFIGGGDGTVRTAAAALVNRPLSLGVLPLGTLNHFAKDLRIPPQLEDAFTTLSQGITRTVDVASVNAHIFINNCSLGSYAEAVRQRNLLLRGKRMRKGWAMLRASVRTFLRFRRMRLRLTLPPDSPQSIATPLLVVANNRYTGHVLAPNLRERLDSGELCLYTAHVHRHLPALRLAWQALTRKLDAADALSVRPSKSAVIETQQRSAPPVAVDGEIVDFTFPLRFHSHPKSLRVLVPRETTDDT